MSSDFEGTFNKIAETNVWGSEDSVSGPGSERKYCRHISAALPGVCEKFEVKTLIDAPCGDLHWMAPVLSQLKIDR